MPQPTLSHSRVPAVALLIFARAPVAKQAKTRLGRRLGYRAAARVQWQLLRHALQLAQGWAGPVELHCSPDTHHAAFMAARRAGLVLRRQRGHTLGQRMHSALSAAHARGQCAVLLGTDCPAMQADDLDMARATLATHALALIPSLDGGYVLIAACKAPAGLFRGIPWSSQKVLGKTLQRGRQMGLSVRLLQAQPDLDYYRDWLRARQAGWLPPLYQLGNVRGTYSP